MRRRGQAQQRLGTILLSLLAALSSEPSWALLQSCEVTATTLPFGPYDPTNPSPLDATGTITVTCSVALVGLLASWTLALSPGGSATYTPRRLANGAATLQYNIFTSAARSTIWGNSSGNTGVISDSQTLLVGSHSTHYTMYGRISPLQDARPGSYSDSIIVTINY
jgi:spore coat protein U-like protein